MHHVGIPAELIRTELDRILASRVFVHADRASRFLRFIVDQTLAQDGASLKEYSIGTAVMGRSESFDPRVDPIVRVEAGRLRSRLKEYYETEGRDDSIKIDLPKGGYVPVFHERQSPVPPHDREELPEAVAQQAHGFSPELATAPPPVRRRGVLIAFSVIALVVIGLVIAVWMSSRAAPKPIRSLAVLPLANLSGDSNQDYFADGMTDALITELGGIGALRVISRTSVMRYKGSETPVAQIARQLKVDAIVEGGVLRAGDRIRITMKLIHAGAERQLWAETYDRSFSDVLALQAEVAQAVQAEVRGKLAGDERGRLTTRRAVVPEAVDAYLRARYWAHKRTAEGLRKAIEYYQQAITADASYALAHSGLADAFVISIAYNLLPSKEYFPKARTAALRALELDDTLAEPHIVLAAVKIAYDWDWPSGEKEHLLAQKLDPGFAAAHQRYALGLMWAGRFEDALAEIEKAQELDPLSAVLDTNECEILYNARQFQRAIDHCHMAMERNPQFFQTRRILGEAYVATGRFQEAISQFETALSLGGGVAVEGKLGHVHAISGNRSRATEILRGLEQLGQIETFFDIAVIYVGLGEKDRAFQWLERCYEEGSRSLLFLKVAPVLDSLRGDPRFSDLVRRRFKSATQ